MIQHLLQLIERTYLNLNLQVETLLLQIGMTAIDSVGDTTCEIHVVILQQDHVKQTDTMVTTTTDLHSLLLQHTHTWCRLTGVEHTGIRTLQALHIPIGHRSDTTHTLHDVQHQALRLQQ